MGSPSRDRRDYRYTRGTTTMNFSQINFDAMTGSQLVDQYNGMAKTLGRDPVRKFESKRVAVARCETLRAIIDDEIVPEPPAKTPKAKTAGLPLDLGFLGPAPRVLGTAKPIQPSAKTKVVRNLTTTDVALDSMSAAADRARGKDALRGRTPYVAPTQPSVKTNIAEKVAKAKAARPAPTKSEDRDARTIAILTKDQANPRREGTDAHAHFERMRDRPTVAQYLGRFAADRRKVARHWLYNTVKDGFAEVK